MGLGPGIRKSVSLQVGGLGGLTVVQEAVQLAVMCTVACWSLMPAMLDMQYAFLPCCIEHIGHEA